MRTGQIAGATRKKPEGSRSRPRTRPQARPRLRTRTVAAAVASVALGLAGCSLESTGAAAGSTGTGTGTTADSAAGGSSGSGGAGAHTALAALATIKVAPAGSLRGYTREKFGTAWADVDHNSCDTRDDVLARDLTARKYRATKSGRRCVVLSGTLDDPYTAKGIHFTKASASKVQIDHVVALADAWRTGASAWSTSRRTSLANDPGNLLAVDGPQNESKGDGDASEWLPPNKAYRCPYVARQVGIKAKYHLTVTPAERDAIRAVLSSCRGQRALS